MTDMTDEAVKALPDEIQVWRSTDTLDHIGNWATTRYPTEAVTYVRKADAELALAEAIRRAADIVRNTDVTAEWTSEGALQRAALRHAANVLEVRAPADALAEVQRLREERDQAQGLIYAARLERNAAEDQEKELANELREVRAERDAALARVERLRHQITEASDPDFIWGALDNVRDAETTLDNYAAAASRAIRAALDEDARDG